MNTALMILISAFCGAAETDKPFLATPVSQGFRAALDDVTSEGPVSSWLTPGWSSPVTGSADITSLSGNLTTSERGAGRTGTVIRGQSDSAYDTAPQTQSSQQTQTYVQGSDLNQGIITGPSFPQGQGFTQDSIVQPSTPQYDPFLGGGDQFQLPAAPLGLEYYDPYSRDFQYGIMGSQPYRLGGLSNYEGGYIANQSTKGVTGHFGVTEANAQWRFSTYLPSGTIFSWKPEFNYRGFDGPTGLSLPGHAYRFASDFEWGAQGPGPWGFQFGFTPQLVTDFDKQLSSDAYSWDGRGMLFFRPDPTLMLVGGVSYWDRVTDRFIPNAGLVWTPDDRWEFRLLYPKSRISVLLGDWGYGGVWLYGSAEYNVEAFQVGITDLNRKDRMEISDYRFLIGLRSDDGFVSSFVEGGWLVDRHVNFKGKTPDFGVQDGWMIRTGIRF